MFISFVSVFSCSSLIGCLLVAPIALFVKYVSPLLVIFIGRICMLPRFGNGRLLCRFLFPLAALSLGHCLARSFRSAAQAELKRLNSAYKCSRCCLSSFEAIRKSPMYA